MRPREIVLNQIRHRETPVVPYTLSIEGEEINKQLDAYYGGTQWRSRIKTYMGSVAVLNNMKKTPSAKAGCEQDPYGSIWRMDRRPFHLETPGLPEPSFKGYKWPKPEEFYADEETTASAQKYCRENKGEVFLLGGIGWGLFETSWGMRGFENALMDVAGETGFYSDLLDKITEQFLSYVDFTCRNLPDVDAIMFGDDWGGQQGVIVGPDRWREFFKPRYAKIYEAVRAKGKVVISHCCGSIADIMPDIIEIGMDVLESVQPEAKGMNPYGLKKLYGDKLTFWGGLGSQSTIQFGTSQQIHEEVRRLRREMAKGGGYILEPAKSIQPGTPLENAVAVVESFTEGDL